MHFNLCAFNKTLFCYYFTATMNGLQSYFGKQDGWTSFSTKDQRGTRFTIGCINLILGIGTSLWISQGVYLQYTAFANGPACVEEGYSEAMSNRFCGGWWNVYISGHKEGYGVPDRTRIPYFAWHRIHPMLTFLMGTLYFVCQCVWLMWERGLVSQYTAGFRERAVPTMTQTGEQRMVQDVRTDNLNYLVRMVQDIRTLDWYCFKYFAFLILTGIVILGQLWYLHIMLDAKPLDFNRYNELYQNMLTIQDERIWNPTDTAILRFPLSFHCLRRDYGSSGTKQKREVRCDNESNTWVEAFYITNIYVLIVLLILLMITFVQALGALVFFEFLLPKRKCKLSNLNYFGYGKRLMLLFLYQNLEPLFWYDLVQALNDSPTRRDIEEC